MPLPLLCDTKGEFWLGLRNYKWKLIKVRWLCLFALCQTLKCYHFTLIDCQVFSSPSFLSLSLLFVIWCFQSLAHTCEIGCHGVGQWETLKLKKKIAHRFTVLTTWTQNRVIFIDHMLASECVISRRNINVNLFAWT